MSTSGANNKYMLVGIDYNSKWAKIYALPNQDALVKDWIYNFGVKLEID